MASSVSSLPWFWVIEALASFKQVDESILIDLIKRAPEISDDLGKNAREMVSLRFLESFIAHHVGSIKGVSSVPDSKIEFDPSERCEDVVRKILHEISASNLRLDAPEMLKWDVQNFVTRKKACLPKCALQQLKDAILEGNHPIFASLKERSGLSISNQSENRIPVVDSDVNAATGRLEQSCRDGQTMAARGNLTSPTSENLDGQLRKDSPIKNVFPSKRGWSNLDTENQGAKSYDDHTSMDNECDPHVHNAKKLKQDATVTSQAVGQKCVPLIGNELLDDSFRRNGQQTVREVSDLKKLSLMGSLEESSLSEDGHDQHIASKIPGERKVVDDTAMQHNHPQISFNNNTVPHNTSEEGLLRVLHVNEAKDDSEHCVETGTSNAAPPDGTHPNTFADEARDKYEKSQLNTANGVLVDGFDRKNFPEEAKDNIEHNSGQEMSSDSDGYQDEKIDVAIKKRTFLSSQYTFSQDSLATADCTELNLCMKCNKGGQLLVCSASNCPLVVHQSCLGSAPSFDGSGNFYCPFCAYSQAILQYLEVKKKASLARKDVAAFIGLENGHRANKLSKRSLRPEQNQLRQYDNANGNSRANGNGNCENEVNNSQYGKNVDDKQEVEPSASCVNGNQPCQEEGTIINDGSLCVSAEGSIEREKMGAECQSESALKRRQIEAQAVCKLGDDNSSCRATEIVNVTEKHAVDGVQREGLLQPITDSLQQAACPPNIDTEESSEEENENITSNYCISLRRREKKHTYPVIPQLRRKKVPWTIVEEELIKEGVKKFASINDPHIPWKRILEFGSDVFLKGRTTIDLKDKWRNLCKGSPKYK